MEETMVRLDKGTVDNVIKIHQDKHMNERTTTIGIMNTRECGI